jgi:hypothetical protein
MSKRISWTSPLKRHDKVMSLQNVCEFTALFAIIANVTSTVNLSANALKIKAGARSDDSLSLRSAPHYMTKNADTKPPWDFFNVPSEF